MALKGRRYLTGEVTLDEIRELAGLFEFDALTRAVREACDELEDYDADVLVVDGDLHVNGNLDLFEEKLYLMVVKGDLVVDGCHLDQDDPESMLLVCGSMKARNMVTAGWLEVHGDLTVAQSLIGDYNDCSALICGDLRTHFFFPEEHFFEVRGTFEADCFYGNPYRMTAGTLKTEAIDDAETVMKFVDAEFLNLYEDEDDDGNAVMELDGLTDFGALKQRVKANEPLKR